MSDKVIVVLSDTPCHVRQGYYCFICFTSSYLVRLLLFYQFHSVMLGKSIIALSVSHRDVM